MEKRKDLSITENVQLVEAFEQERNMVSLSDVSKDYGIRRNVKATVSARRYL